MVRFAPAIKRESSLSLFAHGMIRRKEVERLLLELHRSIELARLGMRGGERVDAGRVFPFGELAGLAGGGDSRGAIAHRGEGRKDPRGGCLYMLTSDFDC